MKYLIFIIGSFAIIASAELPSNVADQKVRDNLEYLDQKASQTTLPSMKRVELEAMKPSREGILYFCNDCSPKKVVVSVGNTKGAFLTCDGTAF